MSAAIETSAFDALPPRERLLAAVLDQLEPMFAMLYDGDFTMGRGAAMDAMEPYVQDERADLATAGQIVACGLASMRVLKLCMNPDASAADLARLTRTVDTLSRTEHRHRTTGLYPPAEPKPAAPKRTPALRAAPAPIVGDTPEVAPEVAPEVTAEPQPPQPKAQPQTPKDHRQVAVAREGHLDGILSAKVSDVNQSVRDHILTSSALNGSMAPGTPGTSRR
jgi:hypothetical protein